MDDDGTDAVIEPEADLQIAEYVCPHCKVGDSESTGSHIKRSKRGKAIKRRNNRRCLNPECGKAFHIDYRLKPVIRGKKTSI